MQSSSFGSRVALVTGILALATGLAACRSRSAQSQTVSPDTWATVDGRSITRDDVDRNFRRAQDQAASLSPEEAMTAKLSILNEMIVQDILLAKARALKVDVPQSELDAAFNDRKKNMNEQQFQEELKNRNLTAEDMKEGLRRELITNKLLEQEVVSKVTVSDEEVTEFYNANRAKFTVAEEAYRIGQIVITPREKNSMIRGSGASAISAAASANR